MIGNLTLGRCAKRKRCPWLAFTIALFCSTNTGALDIDGVQVLRIGTGGTEGIYYPLGTLISEALSPDAQGCQPDDLCGIEGVLAVAQVSNGSISNVRAIQRGELEAALVQSDVAYWSYNGTGIFADEDPATDLRAVARLYDETFHIVVKKDSGIDSPNDLAGKRVSLDEPGSGTLADALLILDAFGLDQSELVKEYIKPEPSGDKLLNDELDAFFHVARSPSSAIERLAAHSVIKIVPIEGDMRDQILQSNKYLSAAVIPQGAYRSIPVTDTLAVSALLVVDKDLDDKLVNDMARVLWSKRAQKIISAGHEVSKDLHFRSAISGLGIPLHSGAKAFYSEQGIYVSE